MKNKLKYKKHELAILCERLNGLSPLSKLSQGYAYAENSMGKSVNTINNVELNEHIKIHVSDGVIEAKVVEKTRVGR